MIKKLKVLSLFSGIGAFEKALTNLEVDYEVVGFSEIDKHAIRSYCAIHNVDETLNLGDISKLNIDKLPKNIDLLTHGSPCFTGDTLVLTNDGYKEIKDIEIGDYVLDHTNNYNKVINFINQGEKEIWKIKAMGLDELKTTENHKFLVRKKSRIWNNETRSYQRNFSSPSWIRCDELNKDCYLGVAINNNSIIPKWQGVECTRGKTKYMKNDLINYFENPKFWYFCGRYLGDGWVRRRKDRNNNLSGVIICCGKHEDKDFEDKIKDLFHYVKVEERTVFKYQFSNKELATFLNQFGKGAKGKFVPSFVLDLPINLLKCFLDGYFDADGHIEENGDIIATSISRELIYGIAQCSAKVYKKPYSIYQTVRPKKCVIEDRIVNQNNSYNFALRINSNQAFYENGYIWSPIRGIENTHKYEEVYDITVENTHSFTANGCIAHNCTDYSMAGKQKGGDKGSGTQSSLMWYSVEIIRHCKPKIVVWENVKNVLSKKHIHNFEHYIQDLESIGYTSYYKVLNAKDFGVPQNRERIYCISILGDHESFEFPEGFPLELRLRDVLEDQVEEKYYLSKEIQNRFKQTRAEGNIIGTTAPEFRTIGQRDLVYSPDGIMGSLVATDYKQPKQIIDIKPVRLGGVFDDEKSRHQAGSIWDKEGISPTLDTMQGGWRQPLATEEPKIVEHKMVQEVKVRKHKVDIEKLKNILKTNKQKLGLTINNISNALNVSKTTVEYWFRNDDCFSIPDAEIWMDLKKLLQIETDEFMDKSIMEFEVKPNCYDMSNRIYDENKITEQQLEINKEGVANTLTTVQKDNYVIKEVQVDENIKPSAKVNFEREKEEISKSNKDIYQCDCKSGWQDNKVGIKVAPTLRASSSHTCVYSDYRIRKLTPLECWRLMGFSDEDFYKAQSIPTSNTQLYKQAGNSIVVPVLEAIFKKLLSQYIN